MKTESGIVVPAHLKSLQQAIDFVASHTRNIGFEPKRTSEIELCVEEVLVNIFNYAYPGAKGDVAINCHTANEGTFIIEIEDSGIPFNILSADDPDIKANIDERHIGGLGIFFVRQLMDGVEYRRDREKNVLSLSVKLPPPREKPGT